MKIPFYYFRDMSTIYDHLKYESIDKRKIKENR